MGGRPSIPRPAARAGAVGVLSLVVALGGGLARSPADPVALRATPFDPGYLVGSGPGGTERTLSAGSEDVILYVSEHCSFCAAELAQWAAALEGHPGPGPLVALSPDSDPGYASRMPRPLQQRWLYDETGRVWSSLGVSAVPFLAVTDPLGLVSEVHVGLSSPARIRALLARRGSRPSQP